MALTELEWETLHDHPELVTFLVEEVNHRPCARLDQPLLKNPNVEGLADDESYLVDQIAEVINGQGLNLVGMLEYLHMESRIKDICRIYARLVLPHRYDENCDKIGDELISADFKVRAGTCHQG